MATTEVTSVGSSGPKVTRIEIAYSDGRVRSLTAAEIAAISGLPSDPSSKAAGGALGKSGIDDLRLLGSDGDMRKRGLAALDRASELLKEAAVTADPQVKAMLEKRATDVANEAAVAAALSKPVSIESLAR